MAHILRLQQTTTIRQPENAKPIFRLPQIKQQRLVAKWCSWLANKMSANHQRFIEAA
ncbi:hypothetical protein [Kingella oralis]|uniref:hypothetical protein n=1 Tax=Kingella oralis TaxID=505 RepID=UPI0034E4D424